MSESGWWKVEASLVVKAVTEDDAINRAADVIRVGYGNVRDVVPVGTFKAYRHRDHVTDALDRAKPDSES